MPPWLWLGGGGRLLLEGQDCLIWKRAKESKGGVPHYPNPAQDLRVRWHLGQHHGDHS